MLALIYLGVAVYLGDQLPPAGPTSGGIAHETHLLSRHRDSRLDKIDSVFPNERIGDIDSGATRFGRGHYSWLDRGHGVLQVHKADAATFRLHVSNRRRAVARPRRPGEPPGFVVERNGPARWPFLLGLSTRRCSEHAPSRSFTARPLDRKFSRPLDRRDSRRLRCLFLFSVNGNSEPAARPANFTCALSNLRHVGVVQPRIWRGVADRAWLRPAW